MYDRSRFANLTSVDDVRMLYCFFFIILRKMLILVNEMIMFIFLIT